MYSLNPKKKTPQALLGVFSILPASTSLSQRLICLWQQIKLVSRVWRDGNWKGFGPKNSDL